MTAQIATWIAAFTLAAHPGLAGSATLAYVPNEGSATISVIDTATDAVTDTLRVGEKPRGIAVDARRLYVSDQTANALVVYDLAQHKQLATVALGSSPEAIYLSPDGKLLSAAIEEKDEVAIVDLATLAVVKRMHSPIRR